MEIGYYYEMGSREDGIEILDRLNIRIINGHPINEIIVADGFGYHYRYLIYLDDNKWDIISTVDPDNVQVKNLIGDRQPKRLTRGEMIKIFSGKGVTTTRTGFKLNFI
jgi:hypothetical protein